MPSLTWKPYRKSMAPQAARLWNRALGDQFPMTLRLFRQNTQDAPGYRADDSMAVMAGDHMIGYALTKRFREQDALLDKLGSTGWIDALVVDPAWQRQGVGRDLLAWAMQKLQTEGAETIRLGGGFRHFLPGVPAGGGWLVDYFSRTGFAVRGTVYDVRGNLRGFSAPPSAQRALAAAGASVSLCQPVDIAALMSFLLAEFPGRWRFDIAWYLEHGGKPQDIVLLRQGLQVVGFAHTYNPRSVFLGSPIYWHRLLGRRYGGLGPIGVAASVRGKGLGLALLQLALQHLARLGVCGAAIDWTDLTDFYARAGFAPWKTYTCMYWPGPARGAA